MLKELFPLRHQYYSSLPLLGSMLDKFSKFLVQLGYPRKAVRRHINSIKFVVQRLQQQDLLSIGNILRADLRACAKAPGRSKWENDTVAAVIRLLERYLDEQGLFPPKWPLNPIEEKLIEYGHYLQEVRGLAASTVRKHCLTAFRFLIRFNKRGGLSYLSKLKAIDVEEFVRDSGKIFGRDALQHIVAHLRSLLRFLAGRGEVPQTLDNQIDTPRVYREEKLPRSLDWEIVCALLYSIDRSTGIGKRDYAILLLMATYGLRSCDIVNLKLDDINWRENHLQIIQLKTTNPLILPLTTDVGESIIAYLRYGRPTTTCRQIFMRHRAPSGILKSTAITEIFQAHVRHSGLPILFQGPHCLRHSYAVHLLGQGVSLKIIGDILGHLSFESTCVYLRLAVEDLRTVPLSLPNPHSSTQQGVLS